MPGHHLHPYMWLIPARRQPAATLWQPLESTKLETLAFVCRPGQPWVSTTLRTITSNHRNLLRISICVTYAMFRLDPDLDRINSASFKHSIGDTTYQEWLELDGLLGPALSHAQSA